jgi:ElaB/YqjD/DUF883 family membrane-anchored ribosome-binding protein
MTGFPNSLEGFLTWEIVSRIASLFSIASLIVTIWVLFETRKVRGPELIKDLHKMASNLSEYLNDYTDSTTQIAEELGKIGSKLKTLQAKLRGTQKNSVKRVRAYIDQYEIKAENEGQVRRVHLEIIKVIEELKDYQKDLDWEK